MNDPSDENAASRETPVKHPFEDDEAEKRRQYVAANRDRIREMNRLWRAEHLDRARELNRDSMRRAAARRHREAAVRARGGSGRSADGWSIRSASVSISSEGWRRIARRCASITTARYYEAHRDEVNARAAARRDADPGRTKQITRQWAERNKERRAELQRNRRSDPEIYRSELEANAAARRLKRSLSRAGLPPKLLHATTAAECRTNEREADSYFNDPSRPEHLRQFTVFAESLTEHVLKNGARMREFAEAYAETRARIGIPPLPADNIVYARAVEIVAERMRRVDLLTGRDVAAAVRSTKTEIQRAERQQQFDRLVKTVVAQVQRDSARYVVDAEMENRARAHQCKQRASVESFVVQLAMQEVIERMPTSSLTIEDARSAARFARQRIAAPFQTGPGATDDPIHRQSVVR